VGQPHDGRVETSASQGRGRAIPIICVATLAYFTGLGLLVPELPQFVTGPLHLGNGVVGASVATFSVASVTGRLPLMWLGDRLSPRAMMVLGAAAATVGDVLFAASGSALALFAMRVIGGLGDALFYTAAVTSMIDAVRPDRVGQAVAMLTSAVWVGLLAGPVAAEAIRSGVGFGPVWWGAAVLSAIAAFGGCWAPRAKRAGVTAARPGSVAVARLIALPLALYVIASVGVSAYTSYVPVYARQLGQPTVTAEFAVLIGGTLLIRPFAGVLAGAVRPRPITAGLLMLTAAGLCLAAAWPAPSGLIAAAGPLAIGQALGFPVLMRLSVIRLPPGGRTGAVAAMTAGFDIGYGAAAAGLGAVASSAGYPAMFGVAALITLLGVGLALCAGLAPRASVGESAASVPTAKGTP
jgi:predicted MFS family arabinose efflux permease